MTQQEHLPHHSSERQQEHLPHHSSERQLEHSTESSTGHKSQPELESIPSKPPLNLIRGILTAYAVGDAMGMPTEFMTRAEISSRFGLVDTLIEPAQGKHNRRHRAGLHSFGRIFRKGFDRSLYHCQKTPPLDERKQCYRKRIHRPKL